MRLAVERSAERRTRWHTGQFCPKEVAGEVKAFEDGKVLAFDDGSDHRASA